MSINYSIQQFIVLNLINWNWKNSRLVVHIILLWRFVFFLYILKKMLRSINKNNWKSFNFNAIPRMCENLKNSAFYWTHLVCDDCIWWIVRHDYRAMNNSGSYFIIIDLVVASKIQNLFRFIGHDDSMVLILKKKRVGSFSIWSYY